MQQWQPAINIIVQFLANCDHNIQILDVSAANRMFAVHIGLVYHA
jgi:hypothetical protein